MEQRTTHPKKLRGVIVSDAMHKTVVVLVTRLKKNPKYQKYYRVTKKFKAHNENDTYKLGDKVVIQETRPISKTKCWEIVAKA